MMTPKKYPQFHHTPKHFFKTPKNIEIQNFKQKIGPNLRIYENIIREAPWGQVIRSDLDRNCLTLLLLSSSENFRKHFRPRPGPTICLVY